MRTSSLAFSAFWARCFAACVALWTVFEPRVALAQEEEGVKEGFDLLVKFLQPDRILYIVAIIAFSVVLARLLSGGLDRVGERLATRRLLLKKIASLTRFALYIIATIIVVFGIIQPERQTLLALGTALGVMIGFAFKDLAGSIIAGIIILIDSPFQVGDRVQFGDVYGEVSEIGLRTVKIITLDDSQISIPNNKFLTEVVSSSNAGALDMMIMLDFHIGMGEDHDLAKKLVYEATITSRYTYLVKPVVVHVLDVSNEGHFATRIRSKFYVIDVRYEVSIRTDITERVKRAFRDAGIRPPYTLERERVRLDPRATFPEPSSPVHTVASVQQAETFRVVRALMAEVESLRTELQDKRSSASGSIPEVLRPSLAASAAPPRITELSKATPISGAVDLSGAAIALSNLSHPSSRAGSDASSPTEKEAHLESVLEQSLGTKAAPVEESDAGDKADDKVAPRDESPS